MQIFFLFYAVFWVMGYKSSEFIYKMHIYLQISEKSCNFVRSFELTLKTQYSESKLFA